MKDLRKLRKVMAKNGMIAPWGERASSLEIVPFGGDLFDPMGQLQQNQPPGGVAEGGSCQTCANGCSTCDTCKSGCAEGCTTCSSNTGG